MAKSNFILCILNLGITSQPVRVDLRDIPAVYSSNICNIVQIHKIKYFNQLHFKINSVFNWKSVYGLKNGSNVHILFS